jgi:hypothetical protein
MEGVETRHTTRHAPSRCGVLLRVTKNCELKHNITVSNIVKKMMPSHAHLFELGFELAMESRPAR